MLVHVLFLACSSSAPDPVEPGEERVMVQMQAAQASGEMLDKQAQDLAQRAREQKGRQWTREEAQALLEELQESENSLEATITDLERSLRAISNALHTSQDPR